MIYCENKLAVCILTYNRIDYLKKSIDSVLNNTSKEFDLIVINDFSSDGTNEYMDTLKNNKSIREIRRKKNIGQFENANFILSEVLSKYCIILHDDDALGPWHIKEVLDLADSDEGLSIVSTGWNTINKNDEVINTNIYPGIKKPKIFNDMEYFYCYYKGLNFPWSGTLIRMDKVKDLRFDNQYRPFRDVVFLNNLALGNKIGYIPKPLFNYRVHDSQQTAGLQKDFDTYYKDWFRAFDFQKEFIIQNNIGLKSLRDSKIARNKTLIFLLTAPASDFKSFFKIFSSKYFSKFLLTPKQWLRLFYKLMKLFLKVK